jgi:alpha-L-arabinofuranosidase
MFRAISLFSLYAFFAVSVHSQQARISVQANEVRFRLSDHMTGANLEDLNFQLTGGLYSQLLFGESFQEPPPSLPLEGFQIDGGWWEADGGVLQVKPHRSAKIIARMREIADEFGVEIMFPSSVRRDRQAGIVFGTNLAGGERLSGYQLSLDPFNSRIVVSRVGRARGGRKSAVCDLPVETWIAVVVKTGDKSFDVSVDGCPALHSDDALVSQEVGLFAGQTNTIPSRILYRNLWVRTSTGRQELRFSQPIPPAYKGEISQYWRPVERGSAKGRFALEKQDPFHGRQSQRVTFVSGQGEVGVDNAGLGRWGISLKKDKPYEGVVRVKTDRVRNVYVSLLSSDGSCVLAKKALKTSGAPLEYERLEFTLTPEADDERGGFAITISDSGTMVLGYAFLQPGPWGRLKGLPLRKDLVEAIVDQGVKVIRFNGSMINVGERDHPRRYYEYDWKRMIGPRDIRQPYEGSFNAYSGHGFGIIDFLNMCEAAGFLAIPGLNVDQSPQDLAGFIEYVNGPVDSPWGSRRVADGHPQPYNLKYIQFGNEERVDEDYALRFKAAAREVWRMDRNITMVVADWMYRARLTDPNDIKRSRARNLSSHVDILKFAKEQGGKIWWDVHVTEASPREADTEQSGVLGIRDLKKWLSEMVPDYDLKIAALEENAGNHDMARALGHAHMKNTLERMGDYVPAVCAPNTVQPFGQYNEKGWDQAQIFFTPSKVWFQPAYYVDQMITRNWVPNVLGTTVESPKEALDVTAKKSDDSRILTVQVVNVENFDVSALIALNGFKPLNEVARVEELKGKLSAENTLEEPLNLVPFSRFWKHELSSAAVSYTFPANSFTVIRFE